MLRFSGKRRNVILAFFVAPTPVVSTPPAGVEYTDRKSGAAALVLFIGIRKSICIYSSFSQ